MCITTYDDETIKEQEHHEYIQIKAVYYETQNIHLNKKQMVVKCGLCIQIIQCNKIISIKLAGRMAYYVVLFLDFN